ncbi:MAG: secretin N-terminal domain-containing protein [Candidatus Riflebacteria bacterium]|nr:secretin N-terminal domain-containing protein [Candidatus Riflebacteria bacterium]
MKASDCFAPASADGAGPVSQRHGIFLVILCLLLGIFCCISPVAATEIRVFKLQYANPDSLVRICENLFAGQATFAASPQINALVVNTDEKELFQQIEKLLAALDRRPATLRFTVKSAGDTRENLHEMKFRNGQFPRVNSEKTTSSRQSERNVIALEFARARFTDDQVRIYSVPGWFGDELAVVTTSHGLSVSGHLTEGGRVLLQVWYAEENGSTTESLLTELEVEAGQWAEFGGLAQGADQRQKTAEASGKGALKIANSKRQTDRRFAVRVDVLR